MKCFSLVMTGVLGIGTMTGLISVPKVAQARPCLSAQTVAGVDFNDCSKSMFSVSSNTPTAAQKQQFVSRVNRQLTVAVASFKANAGEYYAQWNANQRVAISPRRQPGVRIAVANPTR